MLAHLLKGSRFGIADTIRIIPKTNANGTAVFAAVFQRFSKVCKERFVQIIVRTSGIIAAVVSRSVCSAGKAANVHKEHHQTSSRVVHLGVVRLAVDRNTGTVSGSRISKCFRRFRVINARIQEYFFRTDSGFRQHGRTAEQSQCSSYDFCELHIVFLRYKNSVLYIFYCTIEAPVSSRHNSTFFRNNFTNRFPHGIIKISQKQEVPFWTTLRTQHALQKTLQFYRCRRNSTALSAVPLEFCWQFRFWNG